MSAKYSFTLTSQDRRRELPERIFIGRDDTETTAHVLVKLFAFLLFYRPRLQLGPNLHNDNIPFIPDLVELDYELRPKLWIECADCGTGKLNKLAVKVPEAEIWIIKHDPADTARLVSAMTREDLRRQRYHILTLDPEMFAEAHALLQTRNEILWVTGDFEPPGLQLDFNGLWFDAPFTVVRF